MSDEIRITEDGVYQLTTSVTLGSHAPNSACDCLACTAAVRFYALASVFEEIGDYAAADCCYDWAARRDSVGQKMAWAIVEGVYVDGS